MGIRDELSDKANKAKDWIKRKQEDFIGTSAANMIQEYSEVYGEVLVGLHREFESIRPAIEDVRAGAMAIATFNGRLEAMSRQIKLLQNVCWLLGFLLIALGVFTWMTL